MLRDMWFLFDLRFWFCKVKMLGFFLYIKILYEINLSIKGYEKRR